MGAYRPSVLIFLLTLCVCHGLKTHAHKSDDTLVSKDTHVNLMQADLSSEKAQLVPKEEECSGLECLFLDVKNVGNRSQYVDNFDFWPFFQVCCLGLVYGFVLMKGADMISDGSELLLLVPSLEGIVGSVVLPVLGAVPDGAIVLFSGLGANAQQQVSVGVGALAGSTIMLLTIPWFLAILGGRVDIKDGVPDYRKKKGRSKLTNQGCTKSGVVIDKGVRTGGLIMLGTMLSYLIIQIPGIIVKCDEAQKEINKAFDSSCAKHERWFAFAGMLTCIGFFIGYLYYQVKNSAQDDSIREKIVKQIHDGQIGFLTAFQTLGQDNGQKDGVFVEVCRHYFREIDSDNSGDIDMYEMREMSKKLGMHVSKSQFMSILSSRNKDANSSIVFDEFVAAMRELMKAPPTEIVRSKTPSQEDEDGTGDDESDDSDVEAAEEFSSLPKDKQMRAIILKSLKLMGIGTILVLLFSDPMVDLLSNLGERTGVPAFYISFIMAPLASNAAEVVAAYNYATKKTKRSITISLQTLQGACCMNNTFVLGIFLALVFFKHLAWEYTAETIAIVVVIIAVSLMSFKEKHTLIHGAVILTLYPISLALVWLLENKAGLN